MVESHDAQFFIAKLKAAVPQVVSIETKSLGTVYMRRQSGADQARLLGLARTLEASKAGGLPPAAVLAVALMNSDGSPMFADAMEGFRLLSECGSSELVELYDHFFKISGLGARALEDAEKKFSSSQS